MKHLGRFGFTALIILFLTAGLCYGQSAPNQHWVKGVEFAAQEKFNEAKGEFGKVSKGDPYYGTTKRALKVIKDVTDKKIKSETAIYIFQGIVYSL